MIKVVCPRCQSLVDLKTESKRMKCNVCGAQLFSHFKNLSIAEELDELSDKELVQVGFTLAKEHRFTRLGQLADILQSKDRENFWSYAFSIVSKLKFDILTPDKLPEYKLPNNDLNIDIKSRIYFYARKKYQYSGEKVMKEIQDYYPDDIVNYKTSNKMKTGYEVNKETILKLASNISNVHKDLKQLQLLAKEEAELKFIDNYVNYTNYIDFAIGELEKYGECADDFAKKDFEKTPNPGNKGLFLWYSLLSFLALLTLGISSIHIGLSTSVTPIDMHMFDAFGSIGVAAIVLSMIIIIISKTSANFVKKHKTFTAITIILTIALDTAGIATSFASNGVNRYGDWFFIAGLAAGIMVFVYSVVNAIKYMPKNTNKNGTYIGDFKALSKNRFEVRFSYIWPKYKGGKLGAVRVK